MSIKSDTLAIRGKLSFMHLVKPDAFSPNAKPKYSFTLTNLSDAAVEAYTERFGEDAGMGHKRVKFNEKYPDAGQVTKFSSAFPIKVKVDGKDVIVPGRDEMGNECAKIVDPIGEKIGYGSTAVVKVFADKSGNPRAAFVDVIDLVTFDGDSDEDDTYSSDEVL